MSKPYPGYLIVFEGVDGSGKTTLTNNILKALRQKKLDTVLVREPTEGFYGKMIRDNARKGFRFPPEMEKDLFMKDRLENVANTILPSLKKGKIVLMDRYYISTMAYQGARGLNPDDIRTENEKFAPIPDILFVLDIPVSVGLERITKNRNQPCDDFEKENYLEKVRNLFLSFSFPNKLVIDAQQTADSMQKRVMSEINSLLNTREVKK